ncbi:MAG: hypothetical protein QNJ15_00320 [Erythrobacter sp.]|nr:hypothetical protein [Erythrobacter sp.]
MISWMIVPALAFQLVFEPTPTPPRSPAPGTVSFEREVERRRERLERQCYSQQAVEIMIEDMTEKRVEHLATNFNLYQDEVRQAAWSDPFDAEAYRSARRKRAEFLAEVHSKRRLDDIKLFEKLPPEDQVVFARNSTVSTPVGIKRKTC